MTNVAIATATWYPSIDDVRFKQALQMVKMSRDCGYSLISLVDGSPNPEIREAFSKAGAIVEREEPNSTMGMARRQTIRKALELLENKGVVVWLEPEKWPLVPFFERITAPVLFDQADFVQPARVSLRSYPLVQQVAERIANDVFYQATGHKLDIWFGPRVFNEKVAPLFMDYRPEDYQGSGEILYPDTYDAHHLPPIKAIADGFRVAEVVVPYIHPAEQTAADPNDPKFVARRGEQLANLVPAYYLAAARFGLIGSEKAESFQGTRVRPGHPDI